MSEVRITPGGSDFRLMDRKAVDALNRFRGTCPVHPGYGEQPGVPDHYPEFVAPPRFAGHSKFSLKKMLRFALDGITAFSQVPLRLALYVGCVAGLCSLLLLLHVIYVKYVEQHAVPGWATLACAEFFLGGVELIGIGIVGEYVGRIFDEVKQRPLYIIREHIVKTADRQ